MTLIWASQVRQPGPQQTMLIVFGSTGIRMVSVLAGGLLLATLDPYFQQTAFWLWLAVFYLFMLALEVALLRSQEPLSSHRLGDTAVGAQQASGYRQ
jgi:hypothetical protein